MKPKNDSHKVLSYTQAIAKIVEFDVPQEDRNISFPKDPEELFTFVIGILGDYSAKIISNCENTEIEDEDIRFCAKFFNAYKNTERLHYLDNYCLLIGAAAYYLCGLPGSTQVMIKKIKYHELNLQASKLDLTLYWLLNGNYSYDIENNDSLYGTYISNIVKVFQNYFRTGDDKNLVFKACKELRDYVYNYGSPREVFFIDLIYAICVKKIHNSCWENLPMFSKMPKAKWETVITKKNFIKELWPSQLLLGRENIFNGQSAVVQMPTSAGKTKSTEMIIRSAFLTERTNIAVIVAPFRALCHEIESDFYKAFLGEENIIIDEISDAYENSELNIFESSSEKHIIILTPEKLYYFLTQQLDFSEHVGLIIFDEGHQFDSGERGVTYELLLTNLKRFLPNNSQKILISAVIKNAAQIAEWLSPATKVIHGNNTLPTERSIGKVNFDYEKGQIAFNFGREDFYVPKVIPITEMPKLKLERKTRYFPDKKDSKSIALYLALKMSKKENVAIFCGKKDTASSILKMSNDYFCRFTDAKKPKFDFNEVSKISTLISANLGVNNSIYQASQNGIFVHHADIPHGIKMGIEYAMHESLISFVVCTSTLAQGVNLPIKYLFIPST